MAKKPKSSVTVTATMKELLDAVPAIKNLMKIQLPAQQSYHLAKLARLVDQEIQHYQTEHVALIRELGEDVEPSEEQAALGQGTFQRVKSDNLDEFNKRVEEMGKVSVTVEWGPVKLSWFSKMKVAAEDLFGMGPLLIEGGD